MKLKTKVLCLFDTIIDSLLYQTYFFIIKLYCGFENILNFDFLLKLEY